MMSRFFQYVDKVFDFWSKLEELRDARKQGRIPTEAIFLSAFIMLLTRQGSLNKIESDLKVPKRLEGIIGKLKPSADSIGRVFGLMDSEPLREMLKNFNHKLKRNKALKTAEGMRFAAIDGHEFFSLQT